MQDAMTNSINLLERFKTPALGIGQYRTNGFQRLGVRRRFDGARRFFFSGPVVYKPGSRVAYPLDQTLSKHFLAVHVEHHELQ